MDFDSEAWSAMEKKLDKEAGGGTMSGLAGKIAGVVALLLLCSFVGWFYLSRSVAEQDQVGLLNKEQQPKENSSKVAPVEGVEKSELSNNATTDKQMPALAARESQELGENKDKAKKGSEAGLEAIKAGRPGKTDESGEVPEGNSAPLLENNPERQGKSNSTSSIASLEGKDKEMEKGSKSSMFKEEGLQQFITPMAGNDPAENQGQQAPVELEKEGKGGGNSQGFLALQRRQWEFLSIELGQMVPSMVEIVPEADSNNNEAIIPEEKKRSGRGIPLSVMLSVAPDFTGTEQKGSSKIGAGAGILVEYEFIPNLTLVTGAFYSKKNYLADQSFSPYGNLWDYYPAPSYIDASCGVIDVPLNLRYYAYNRKRNRIFLSAGASSYLMKSEDYTLVYESSYYKDYTYSIKNQNKHLFAIYNFSVGYQRSLGPHWSLQIEPFMKVPAKGVGIGTVKLNSMGAFLHLKYSFGK